MTFRRLSIALTAAAVFAMVFPVAASANHSWGNYHWERSTNPLTLSIGDNVSGHWDARLTQTIAEWNASEVLELTEVSGRAKRNCRPTSGRVEVCNGSYGQTGWLGIAQIWASGGHITQGVAKLNDTYHDSPPYDSSAWRQLVMCQEVAHTFGLGHQNEDFSTDETDSCMEYTSDPTNNTGPDAHDFAQLEAIYAHLDAGGGDGGDGGGGPCRGGPKKCGHPIFGEAFGFDADGHPNVFVRPDRGQLLITHVTWLPGHHEGHDH